MSKVSLPKLDALRQKMQDEAMEKVTDIAKSAEGRMVKTIATSGTGYVGKGPRAVPEGRIDYGPMIDSVRVEKTSPTSVRVGWLNYRYYFGLQEEGTYRPGGVPMYAFAQMKTWVGEQWRNLAK